MNRLRLIDKHAWVYLLIEIFPFYMPHIKAEFYFEIRDLLFLFLFLFFFFATILQSFSLTLSGEGPWTFLIVTQYSTKKLKITNINLQHFKKFHWTANRMIVNFTAAWNQCNSIRFSEYISIPGADCHSLPFYSLVLAKKPLVYFLYII